MFRRLLRQLFKRYQLIVLEPREGRRVRNVRINLAAVMALALLISLGSAAMAWFYVPPRAVAGLPSARYDQLQQQQRTLRGRLATMNGEFTLARAQVDGLKNELLSSQRHSEALKQRLNIYVSILRARKSGGVHILRATAYMQDHTTLHYSLVLVKGGNYPRSVSGSIHITALDNKGQKLLLRLGKNTNGLPYRMDTHIFLDGKIAWRQDWQPSALRITRLNVKGEKRAQVEVELNPDPASVRTHIAQPLDSSGASKQLPTIGEKGG